MGIMDLDGVREKDWNSLEGERLERREGQEGVREGGLDLMTDQMISGSKVRQADYATTGPRLSNAYNNLIHGQNMHPDGIDIVKLREVASKTA